MTNQALRMLVVEDDEDDFLLLHHMLKQSMRGTSVDRAATAEEAVQRATRETYDLFLLDYRLGGSTGMDVLKQFKKQDISSPVIFLTGRGDEEIAVEAMKAGAIDYLAKAKLTETALQRAILYACSLQEKEATIRRAQQDLAGSERRFRALVENSYDAITLLDASGHVIYASPSCERVLGYRSEELLGAINRDFVHPDDRATVAGANRQAQEQPGRPVTIEYRFRQKDGSWRWLEATGVNRLEDTAIGAIVINHRDISEQRQARDELRETAEALRAMYEASPLAITLLGADGAILRMNSAAEAMYGWSTAEVQGCKIPDEPGRHKAEAALARVLESNSVVSSDTMARRRDGTEFPISVWMAPLRDAHGAISGAVSIVADITERTTMEQALRESERQYRMLFESANDAILIIAPESEEILEANTQACAMYGYPREELIGRSLKSMTVDVSRGEEQLRRLLRDGSERNFETVHFAHDGREIPLLVSSSVIEYQGRAAVLTLNRDISVLKTAEREREQATAALRASEQRYRLLFERNLAGVVRTRLDGTILECNDSLARSVGYASGAELVGMEAAQLYFDPAQRIDVLRRLQEQGNLVNEELKFRRADGKPVWALANISLRRDDDHEPVIEATSVDITDRRQLQEQLLQSQKMEAVGQLAGGIAHDFNNLLMIISSYTELLAERVACDPELHKSAEEIHKAARKAATLTRQLLAFSRKQVLSPRLMDLNQVIADAGKLLPRLIGENIEIAVLPAKQIWPVKADPVQLDQVLMNLAVNARDAMPRGGRLTLETRNVHLDEEYARTHAGVQPGDYVVLAVTDNGDGIPADVLPHIFEPFFTTKALGKGTGLGLPTVYGIVKQSGGSLWVYSEAGHGTVFKIYLPRAQRETREAAPSPSAMRSEGNETILLVEDEDALRQVTSDFLRSRGYRILQANGAEEATRVAASHPGAIDVLVTDVIMPGKSGRELADRLKAVRPEIRVVYMSGYTEATVVQHGVEPGTTFLQKPFALADLAAKVREVLDLPKTVAA